MKIDRRKSATHHRVEEGQKPTKRGECSGDAGAAKDQAEGQRSTRYDAKA